jgi:hypothetical protein
VSIEGDLGARGWVTGVDDDQATLPQQHAGWSNTYLEHGIHVRHRAHVPITNVLVEGLGSLHRGEGRNAVLSERRSRNDGMGDE